MKILLWNQTPEKDAKLSLPGKPRLVSPRQSSCTEELVAKIQRRWKQIFQIFLESKISFQCKMCRKRRSQIPEHMEKGFFTENIYLLVCPDWGVLLKRESLYNISWSESKHCNNFEWCPRQNSLLWGHYLIVSDWISRVQIIEIVVSCRTPWKDWRWWLVMLMKLWLSCLHEDDKVDALML